MNHQKLVQEIGQAVFGYDKMNDKRERALRFGEEAMELMRAVGLSLQDVANLMDYKFDRPAGNIEQEIAGVGVTLYALADNYDVDVDLAVEREILRVLRNADAIRAKHAAKPASVKTSSLANYYRYAGVPGAFLVEQPVPKTITVNYPSVDRDERLVSNAKALAVNADTMNGPFEIRVDSLVELQRLAFNKLLGGGAETFAGEKL